MYLWNSRTERRHQTDKKGQRNGVDANETEMLYWKSHCN